jgi:hypothetical protein
MGPRLREDDVMVGNGRKKITPPATPAAQKYPPCSAPRPCLRRWHTPHSPPGNSYVKVIDVHRVRPRFEQNSGEREVHLFAELT